MKVKPKELADFLQSDGLRSCVSALKHYLDHLGGLAGSFKIAILDEMVVKSLMNLLYTAIYGYSLVYTDLAALKSLLEGKAATI